MYFKFQVVIDAAEPAKLADFWAFALDYVLEPPPHGFETWEDFDRSIGMPEEELFAALRSALRPGGGVAVDPVHNLLITDGVSADSANRGERGEEGRGRNSILIFDRTANGDAEPLRPGRHRTGRRSAAA